MDVTALLHRPLSDLTWIAFDTEATGYSNVTARLVEVAGTKFRFAPGTGAEPTLAGDPEAPLAAIEELGTFQELVNPGVPMPPEVVAIHGLDDAAVADAAPPGEVLERFFAFAEGAVLVAHYAPFDLGAIAFARVRAGKGVPRLAAVDTSVLPKRLFPGAPNYALETLVKFLALPRTDAHRALPDACAARDLFRRCVAAMGDPRTLKVSDVAKLAGPVLTLEHFSEIPYTVPAELSEIDRAIAEHVDLMVEYRGGSKGGVPRRVTPSHLFAKDHALFLEGFCHLDQAPKSFRIDRITTATPIAAAPGDPVLRNRGNGRWVLEPRETN